MKLNLVYLDCENIGGQRFLDKNPHLNELFAFSKVFAFSNNQASGLCGHPFVCMVDDYETGANQADFAIVSHLSSYLAICQHLGLLKGTTIAVMLYSHDNALCSAFKRVCERFKVGCTLPLTADNQDAAIAEEWPKLFNGIALSRIEHEVFLSFAEPTPFQKAKNNTPVGAKHFVACFHKLLQNGLLEWSGSKSKKIWYIRPNIKAEPLPSSYYN